MELRIPFRRRPAILGEQVRVVEIDGRVTFARRIHILDGEVLAGGSRAQQLPADLERHLVDAGGIQPCREARVDRVDPNTPVGRVGDGRLNVTHRENFADDVL